MTITYIFLGLALIVVNTYFIMKGLKSLKNGGW